MDDITIWYDTKNIKPEKEEQPIHLYVKKVLFGYDLKVDGARQYVDITGTLKQ